MVLADPRLHHRDLFLLGKGRDVAWGDLTLAVVSLPLHDKFLHVLDSALLLKGSSGESGLSELHLAVFDLERELGFEFGPLIGVGELQEEEVFVSFFDHMGDSELLQRFELLLELFQDLEVSHELADALDAGPEVVSVVVVLESVSLG